MFNHIIITIGAYFKDEEYRRKQWSLQHSIGYYCLIGGRYICPNWYPDGPTPTVLILTTSKVLKCDAMQPVSSLYGTGSAGSCYAYHTAACSCYLLLYVGGCDGWRDKAIVCLVAVSRSLKNNPRGTPITSRTISRRRPCHHRSASITWSIGHSWFTETSRRKWWWLDGSATTTYSYYKYSLVYSISSMTRSKIELIHNPLASISLVLFSYSWRYFWVINFEAHAARCRMTNKRNNSSMVFTVYR